MTGIAAKLKEAGYEAHIVGKWHAGGATPDHISTGHGFERHLDILMVQTITILKFIETVGKHRSWTFGTLINQQLK